MGGVDFQVAVGLALLGTLLAPRLFQQLTLGSDEGASSHHVADVAAFDEEQEAVRHPHA